MRSYDSTWKCGECLYNGYKSCVKTEQDHSLVTAYDNTDTSFSQCCLEGEYCKYTYEGWTCTEAYNNTLYAKYACPFVTTLCGDQDVIDIADVGS